MYEAKGEPYDPSEDGFVFSEHQINQADPPPQPRPRVRQTSSNMGKPPPDAVRSSVRTLENKKTCEKVGTAHSVPRRRNRSASAPCCVASGQSGLSPLFSPRPLSPALSFPSLPERRSEPRPTGAAQPRPSDPRKQENLRKGGDCPLCPKAPQSQRKRPLLRRQWTERAVPTFSPRPLSPALSFPSLPERRSEPRPTGVAQPRPSHPRKQENLRKGGDCPLCPKAPQSQRKRPLLRRQWTERAVPTFSPCPLSPALSFPSLPERRSEPRPTGVGQPRPSHTP